MEPLSPGVRNDFRLVAEVHDWDGDRRLGAVALPEPDWDPALQCAYFQGVRRGTAPCHMRCAGGSVEPLWHAVRGRPFVQAFRVRPGVDGVGLSMDLPITYLRSTVREATGDLVERGVLEQGAPFRFRICAYRAPDREGRPPWPDGVVIETLTEPLPVTEGSLDVPGFARRDLEAWDDADFPVFLAGPVLEEAAALAEATPDLETGGLLLGRVLRDRSGSELFVKVTAQIPARHTRAAPDRLTFTNDTWAAARAAVDLRGGDELLLGWWHSHPDLCGDCSREARATCPLARPFLSPDDRALHRTMFGRPFDLALLVADLGPRGRECALYGWREGLLVRRGYSVPRTAASKAPGSSRPAADSVVPTQPGALRPTRVQKPASCGGRDASQNPR